MGEKLLPLGNIAEQVLANRQERARIGKEIMGISALFTLLENFVAAHPPPPLKDLALAKLVDKDTTYVECTIPLRENTPPVTFTIKECKKESHYNLSVPGLGYSFEIWKKTGRVITDSIPFNKEYDDHVHEESRPMEEKDIEDVKELLRIAQGPKVKINSHKSFTPTM